MVDDKKLLLILILSIFMQKSNCQTASQYVYCNTQKEFALGQSYYIYFAETGNTKTTCEYIVKSPINSYIAVDLYHNLEGSGTSCTTAQYVEVSPDGDPYYRSGVKYCGLRDGNNPLRFNTIQNELRFRVVCNDLKRTVQVKMQVFPVTTSNCSCSWNPSTRIAYGSNTASTSFTANVALMVQNAGFYEAFCGGTIISSRHVLTAGHCVPYANQFGISNVLVHVGRQNVNREIYSDTSYSEKYSIANITLHPFYNGNGAINENDLAIIRLTTSIRYCKGVGPACIPHSYKDYSIPSGTTLTAIGFGATSYDKQARDDSASWILQSTSMIVNQSLRPECNQLSRICCQGKLNSNGDTRADTCQRDSGTAVYAYINNMYTFIGITSEGDICGTKVSYAINVNVPYYIPWIKSVIESFDRNEFICNKV